MSPAIDTAAEAELQGKRDSIIMESQIYQKGVKNLCDEGISKVPTKYILPPSDRPNCTVKESELKGTSGSGLHLKLPLIDFAELQGPNRSHVLHTLSNACQQYGFFQVVNHGIPEHVTSSMIDVGRRFFDLPLEERSKYMSIDMHKPVRCGTSFNQTKDGVFCWRDFLKIYCHPLSDVLPHWPSSPHDFRKMAVTYSKETKFLFLMLTEAILESLGLLGTTMMTKKKKKTAAEDAEEEEEQEEEDEIMKEFREGSQLMVLNCYPPCPQPELTLGMPAHSDYGFLTLLLQDNVPGLQIQFQGQWLTLQPLPNSFVVNVGDHLEIFSNGRYKSVLHRVVANSANCRISVASLHSLPFDYVIRPSPRLIDEENPRRYTDTDFASFLDYISSCEPKKKNFLESRKLT
ncbi:probable 2-oxoglutarate-dependent dioxygenase SLC1 [Malania oleifera]|uniref:probable 2-oxoglutarate-dependent dioxygenase SLC1 n=1 Tax=Malania oleifera TaxID=397392 RepID=UPI0025ADA2BC|nr:probable 2-oxoglutarate-dependent dioxygenase SLC1 [Malania oleifera]